MRVMYNFALAVEHILGTILLVSINASRFIFWVTWTSENEIFFIVCAVVVFALHYLFLLFGYKKKLVRWGVIYGLQLMEKIFYIPQLVLIVLSYVLPLISIPFMGKIPLALSIPVIIIDIAYLISRKISAEYLYCRI